MLGSASGKTMNLLDTEKTHETSSGLGDTLGLFTKPEQPGFKTEFVDFK